MIRSPAVAGRFYPGDPESLRRQIEEYLEPIGGKKLRAKGVVSPHAGYVYSGPVAGAVLSAVEITDTVVILGPNHTGLGAPYAIMAKGEWKTPLGNVEIDSGLAAGIVENGPMVTEDPSAHAHEHSLEVQVPFLQVLKPGVKIVPIVVGGRTVSEFHWLGGAIARAIQACGKDVLVLASSDMTHYEPHEEAREKDSAAIDAILKLDGDMLMRKVRGLGISMCGYAPTIAMLTAAKDLGAREAKLIRYMTSGETSGDYSAVVGYAGIAVY
ncbi:MAG: AmmeMemoRadiSam system protein B [Candidatus Tritonobacter lacicola]|nr:AmmeMemoRadiSam system protein B [Candidatus Tritonobacter lacicola]